MAYTIGRTALPPFLLWIINIGLLRRCSVIPVAVSAGCLVDYRAELYTVCSIHSFRSDACHGTGSSEVVMPRMMDKLAKAGCDRAVVGLVVPTDIHLIWMGHPSIYR